MGGFPTGVLRLRGVRRGAALAGLAAMLFAQAALALAACTLERDARARGMAQAASAGETPPCHEAQAADPLCSAHCQASEPLLDKHTLKPPLPPVAPAPAFVPPVSRPLAVFVPARQVPAASPPARILYQSLLI